MFMGAIDYMMMHPGTATVLAVVMAGMEYLGDTRRVVRGKGMVPGAQA